MKNPFEITFKTNSTKKTKEVKLIIKLIVSS